MYRIKIEKAPSHTTSKIAQNISKFNKAIKIPIWLLPIKIQEVQNITKLKLKTQNKVKTQNYVSTTRSIISKQCRHILVPIITLI